MNEDLQGFGRQLYEAHARSGAVPLRLGQRIKGPVINEGPIEINFVDKKGTNIGERLHVRSSMVFCQSLACVARHVILFQLQVYIH